MLCFILAFLVYPGIMGLDVLDQSFWRESALAELKAGLAVKHNTNVAKNVILFIGDGMGPNTITAARIFSEGETGYLSWEKFPQVGMIKTYSRNKQVPDSAATATAMYTGVKVHQGTLGVDVKRDDCDGSLLEENRLVTLASLAQEAGKSTGIVTTTRITHATPGAMYAHSAERDWECDSSIPSSSANCKDIARQLIEDNPGKKFNVVMGGGRQLLKANAPNNTQDPIETKTCVRTDGRDLITEWAQGKESEGVNYAVTNNTKSLLNVDTAKTDYLLGIFYNDHFPYDYVRDKSENGVPSLEQMTTTAIKILMKNQNGFVLMVEGGKIDLAHHDGLTHVSLCEVIELSKAINSTMQLLEAAGIKEETLVMVTSDHSHTLTISGYPDRGNNVLGMAGTSPIDHVPYTTISYANGGKNNYHYKAENGSVVREDPTLVDTTSFSYGPQVGVLMDQNTHGGSDVLIYATGPYAHLFHNMHEQNYINSVIKYATRMGEFSTADYAGLTSSSSNFISPVILLAIAQITFYICK